MSLLIASELAKHTGAGKYKDDESGILSQIIESSELEITAELSRHSMSMPASSDVLKAASLKLSMANLILREWFDASRPTGLNSAEYIGSQQVQQLKADARQIIDHYVRTHGTYDPYRYYVRKVNG